MGAQIIFLNPASMLALLLTLLNSGVRDLVGLLPTDDYWRAKHVTVSVEQLTHELESVKAADVSALIADLNADDPRARDEATLKIAAIGLPARAALEKAAREGAPETAARANALLGRIRATSKAWSVRRLMAIRTLGERKDQKTLAVLRPLLESKEPFEADYARAAIAKIEAKEYEAPRASDADRAADVALLPARLDALAQIALTKEGRLSIDDLLATYPVPADQKPLMRAQIVTGLLGAMETAGNVRLDALTIGFYAAPPGVPGNFAYVARGQFDPAALSAFLAVMIPKNSKIDGGDLFNIDDDNALLVTHNQRIIYLVREPMGDLGLDAIEASLKRGAGDFADNPDLPKLLKSIDVKAPFWAAMHFNPGMREVAGPLGQFDTATLVGKQTTDADNKAIVQLRLEAISSDAAIARQAASALEAMMRDAVAQGREEQKKQPAIKPLVDFAQSVKIECIDGKATATASLPDITPLIPALVGQSTGQVVP